MKHIFISHAGADGSTAARLQAHLKNAGHDAKVDTQELTLGINSIEFMNQGIAEAHTIIILHSCHTPNASWQKLEIDAAVWNQTAQNGGMCIVIRLDETPVPPLLGPRLYGRLDVTDPSSWQKVEETGAEGRVKD
jgi:TIR domain